MNKLILIPQSTVVRVTDSSPGVPILIAEAGEHATRRFLEFFAATIRNKNTRMAHYRAAGRFFAWCDRHGLGELGAIEPLHVAAYIEAMQRDYEALQNCSCDRTSFGGSASTRSSLLTFAW